MAMTPCIVYAYRPTKHQTEEAYLATGFVLGFTRTYWGAKRMKRAVERVQPALEVHIKEVWNRPSWL